MRPMPAKNSAMVFSGPLIFALVYCCIVWAEHSTWKSCEQPRHLAQPGSGPKFGQRASLEHEANGTCPGHEWHCGQSWPSSSPGWTGHAAVPNATVPEAAIDKDGEAFTAEDEIGSPKEWLLPSSTGYTIRTKDGRQRAHLSFCAACFPPLLHRLVEERDGERRFFSRWEAH
jgi:hypothetical protein